MAHPRMAVKGGGHRENLRRRFAKCGLEAFAPHEILEFLLTFVIPRRDVKPLARDLLHRFGSIHAVLDADGELLEKCCGLGRRSALFLRLMKEISQLYFAEITFPVGASGQDTRRQLRAFWSSKLALEPREYLEVAYLDGNLCLLPDGLERIYCGDVRSVSMQPQQILAGAVKCKCSALFLCHNHPNGDVLPSEHDERLTKVIELLLQTVGVQLVDHWVASAGHIFSIKEQREI
jgi:DNA repair protein RadC